MLACVVVAPADAGPFADTGRGARVEDVPLAPSLDPTASCDRQGQAVGCLLELKLPGSVGTVAYYASLKPGDSAAASDLAPSSALVVLHGYPRDAAHSFDAGVAAVRAAGLEGRVAVFAPLFQVVAADEARCSTAGEAPARPGELRWRCGGWLAGDLSVEQGRISSFAVLDRLTAELARQYPSLHAITLFGFSAGAQLLQHYVGFAAPAPDGVRLRHVIADPGTWLYFDPVRPGSSDTERQACPAFNRWKYGLDDLPKHLGRSAGQARDAYRDAAVFYVAGALDNGPGRGTFDKVLDHGCSAELQGPYRLQRAQAYATYAHDVLQPRTGPSLIVVPGCAHDAACVLRSPLLKRVLFEDPAAPLPAVPTDAFGTGQSPAARH